MKRHVTPEPADATDRKLGHGSWNQIEHDLRQLVAMGASHVVLDPDVPLCAPVRAGADPWPWLERAVRVLRASEDHHGEL